MKKLLSVIIISDNQHDYIADCLRSVNFADEIIFVSNATDNTNIIAGQTIPSIKIFPNVPFDYSKSKNLGVQKSHGDWLLFIDSDEIVTQALKTVIQKVISDPLIPYSSYDFPRANFFLGKRVCYGNTYPDYVKRLIYRSDFLGFSGHLHEQPQVSGKQFKLSEDLLHYTHRNLSSMMVKSIRWTDMEAKMLLADGHPPVVWWRILRMMVTKIWQRLIVQQMWRDGTVGWISAIFESFDTFMIYARLWELQQK